MYSGNSHYQCTTVNQPLLITSPDKSFGEFTATPPIPLEQKNKTGLLPGHRSKVVLLFKRQKVQCETCGKNYSSRKSLKIHMRTHTGYKPYRCSICPKSFSQSNVLKAHINAHTGQRDFFCKICGRAFTQSAHMKTHERIHSKRKDHSCTFCNRNFGSKGVLIRHFRQHTGEKPYRCARCPKSFTRAESLRSHENSHDGIRPHLCKYSFCNSTFTKKSSRKRHEKTCHREPAVYSREPESTYRGESELVEYGEAEQADYREPELADRGEPEVEEYREPLSPMNSIVEVLEEPLATLAPEVLEILINELSTDLSADDFQFVDSPSDIMTDISSDSGFLSQASSPGNVDLDGRMHGGFDLQVKNEPSSPAAFGSLLQYNNPWFYNYPNHPNNSLHMYEMAGNFSESVYQIPASFPEPEYFYGNGDPPGFLNWPVEQQENC